MKNQIKTGTENYFTEKELDRVIDDSMKYGMIFLPIAMLIGAGIIFGGFALYRRGKRDSQVTDTFNFD